EPIATFTRTGTTRVMVTADSGLYLIDDAAVAAEGFALNPGRTYIFDWSGATDHPVRLSETADGIHGGGDEYKNGVTIDDETGRTTVAVTDATPTLYVYCEQHAAMGFDTPVEDYEVPTQAYSLIGATLTVTPQAFGDLAADNAVEIAIAYKIADGDLADGETYIIDNTATITITGLNTRPQIIDDMGTTDNTGDDRPNIADVTTPEDTPYVFVLDDFNYVDLDNDPMASVLITQLPNDGTLTLGDGQGNDAPITAPLRISRANIESGLLTYTPALNDNGDDYTAFTYAVSDGTDDSDIGAMTVHVTPVNDPPTSSDQFVAIIGEMPVVFNGDEFAFEDSADGDVLSHVTLLTAPQNGKLYLLPSEVDLPSNPRANGKAFAVDGMALEAAWEITITDPQAGFDIQAADLNRLVYLADAKASDLNYDEFTFTVNDGASVDPTSLDSETPNRIILGQLVAQDRTYTISEDSLLVTRPSEGVGLQGQSGTIANLSFDFDGQPARGVLTPLANGHFEFTPQQHFYDVDNQSPANIIDYTISANGMTSEPGKITIIVVPTNDRPDVVGKIGNFQRPPGEEIKPISLIAENIFADIDRFDPRLNNFSRLTDKPNPVGSQTGASFDDIPDHGQLTYAIEGLPDGLTWNGVDKITGTTSQAGRHLITITATDGGQLSNTKSFYINIMKPVIERVEFPEAPEPIERKFEKPEETKPELNPHDLPPVMRLSADEGANRQINNELNRPQMGGRDALPLADDNAGLGDDSWMNAKTSSQLDISGNIRVIDLKVEGREIAVQITDEASDPAELFTGELADGSPLPSWVKVDRNTGLTTADPPPGSQPFEMRVVAEDGAGNSRAIDLVLDPTMIKGESDTGRQIADDKVVNNAATNSTNDATQAIVENTPLSRPTGATRDANPSSSTVDVLNDGRVVFGETSEAAPSGALKLMRMVNETDGVKIEITDDAREGATRYAVRQKDGSAAPDWVQVNAETGELTIDAPQNVDAIELTIVALDGGEQRTLDVEVDLEETRLQPLGDNLRDTQGDTSSDDERTGEDPAADARTDNELPVSQFVPLEAQIDSALTENSYGRDIQEAMQSLN
ncbi:MAG: Ig-like domain-containing protein, partial [Alphaproteobacteria bacterium]|nr:Ig-like domain-containing protein [Alphaproteobacteria bacterium]